MDADCNTKSPTSATHGGFPGSRCYETELAVVPQKLRVAHVRGFLQYVGMVDGRVIGLLYVSCGNETCRLGIWLACAELLPAK